MNFNPVLDTEKVPFKLSIKLLVLVIKILSILLGEIHNIMLNSAILEIQITMIKTSQNVHMAQCATARTSNTGLTSNTLQDHARQRGHRTVSHTFMHSCSTIQLLVLFVHMALKWVLITVNLKCWLTPS